MLSVMLHDLGWIDVSMDLEHVVVRVNPSTVHTAAVESLWKELDQRAPDRRIRLTLMDEDIEPTEITFLDGAHACDHLGELIERRDTDGVGDSIFGPEAFPSVEPFDISAALPLRALASDSTGLDGERFARRLAVAEWLAPLNTSCALDGRQLIDREPEMVTFAIRSLGWVALLRNWTVRHTPFRASPPEIVALDPTAASTEILTQLVALCDAWRWSPQRIIFAWWDGRRWMQRAGTADQIADSVRTLCRIAANDDPLGSFDSVQIPLADLVSRRSEWADSHPFSHALQRWVERRAVRSAGDQLLGDLDRLGVFQQRTKLLEITEGNVMRISRYAPGRVDLWNERDNGSMVGRSLNDVPDRRLGLSVQRDLVDVYRSGAPTLHQCRGMVNGSDGLMLAEWVRFTLPLFSDDGTRVTRLLSTCELRQSVAL
jgi:hypothetical protein